MVTDAVTWCRETFGTRRPSRDGSRVKFVIMESTPQLDIRTDGPTFSDILLHRGCDPLGTEKDLILYDVVMAGRTEVEQTHRLEKGSAQLGETLDRTNAWLSYDRASIAAAIMTANAMSNDRRGNQRADLKMTRSPVVR